MALLVYDDVGGISREACGGSLITNNIILTAAHCLEEPTSPDFLKLTHVRLGVYNKDFGKDCPIVNGINICNPDEKTIGIKDIKLHENYRREQFQIQNDIGLIRLAESVEFTKSIKPICLAKNIVTNTFLGSGWGLLGLGNGQPGVLQKVVLDFVDHNKCKRNYLYGRIIITDTQLCAGGFNGKDTCAGDSGGPLMQISIIDGKEKWEVAGITSYGAGDCGLRNLPGVYTKVNSYLDWIADSIKPSK